MFLVIADCEVITHIFLGFLISNSVKPSLIILEISSSFKLLIFLEKIPEISFLLREAVVETMVKEFPRLRLTNSPVLRFKGFNF